MRALALLLSTTICTSSLPLYGTTAFGEQAYVANINQYDGNTFEESNITETKSDAWGATTTGEGNIALNKPATSSSNESNNTTPEKAVDGKIGDNNRWNSGSMDKNQETQTPSWLVLDLGVGSKSTASTITLDFFKKVWPTKYKIQTSDNNASDAVWEDVYASPKRENEDKAEVTDTIKKTLQLKRYVRFYFESMNTSNAGTGVSVEEITIIGTTTYTTNPGANADLQTVVNSFGQLPALSVDDVQVKLPLLTSNGYQVKVVGSNKKQIISEVGAVSQYNLEDTEVTLLLEISNKENPSQSARLNRTVVVPGKKSKYTNIFPKVAQPNVMPEIIPSLQEWSGYEGDFQLSVDTKIIYNDKKGVNLKQAAEIMKEDLKEISGLNLSVQAGTSFTSKDIYLEVSDNTFDVGEEGYVILNNDNGFQIYASTYTGAYYGGITLEQHLWLHKDTLAFPKGVIRDYPDYKIRGIMLDIARSPYRIQFLNDYSKMLSWYKMNEFHVHLNDNRHRSTGDMGNYNEWEQYEGMFRLESETFPSLETSQKDNEYYNTEFGGSPQYSKEEYVAFQKNSERFGVDIVSEIDAPGHSLAFTRYVKNNLEEAKKAVPSIKGNIHSPRNWELLAMSGENYQGARDFIKTLFKEYVNTTDPVFIGDTVHIGVDEYWQAKPEEYPGLKNYIDDITKIVKDTGKKVRLWGSFARYFDDAKVSTAPYVEDVVIDCWAYQWEDYDKRLKEGFDIVNADSYHLYGNPGRDHRDIVNVEWLYENWNPTSIRGGNIKEGEPGLLGAKTALWADISLMGVTERDSHERALNAVGVVAEKTWNSKKTRTDYDDFAFKFSGLKEGPGTNIGMNTKENGNLIVNYDFSDSTNKTAYDVSGNGYHGEITNGTIEKLDGVNYLKFDGTTKVQTGLESINYPYTVSFDLINSGGNTNKANLFSSYDGRLQLAGLNGQMSINRSYFQQTTGYTVPENQKVNVSIVGTQQAVKVYVNGNLVKFLGSKGGETNYANLMSTFVFPMNTIGENFVGYIGNIKAYQVAFSPQLIKDLNDKTEITKVNISQKLPVSGDSQTIGAGDADSGNKLYVGWKAVDGDGKALDGSSSNEVSERTSSFKGNDKDTLSFQLNQPYKVTGMQLQWDQAPSQLKIQTSEDGKNYKDVQTVSGTLVNNITFATPITSKYLRIQCLQGNFSLREVEIYETANHTTLKKVVDLASSKVKELGLSFDDLKGKEEFYQSYTTAKSLLGNPVAPNYVVEKVKIHLEKSLEALENGNALLEEKKKELSTLIAESGKVDLSNITEESKKAFEKALVTAKNTILNQGATLELLQEALTTLQTAKDNLKIKEPVEKEGWVQVANGWKYKNEKGDFLKNCSKVIGQSTYCFDTDGYMVTGWNQSEVGWRYFGGKNDGVMKTGWQNINGGWYYLNPEKNARMETGWQVINSNWYYLGNSNDGAMKTGWQAINGSWYYLGDGNDGSMKTGWQAINGSWYYLGHSNDGTMKKGWQIINGSWYYLGNSNDGSMKTGWQVINGSWYYLGQSNDGTMKTGWLLDQGKWYYLGGSNDGAMKLGWILVSNKYYFADESGKLLDGTQTIYGKTYRFVNYVYVN